MDYLENFNREKVHHLYRLLIRDYYYDYVNLFARRQLAEYENSGEFESDIEKLLYLLESPESEKAKDILNVWLDNVDFRLLPKKVVLPQDFQRKQKITEEVFDNKKESAIKNSENDFNVFISNLRTSKEYYLTDIHYFAHVPIPLLLISMLWVVTVGVLLDQEIDKHCFGNRLNLTPEKEISNETFSAFKYYLPEYNRWRDLAIDIGLHNLQTGNDILLVALDIKHCYYRLSVRWPRIEEKVTDADISVELKKKYLLVNELLQKIHKAYHDKTKSYLARSHFEEEIQGIPIGLPSSKIISNYELLDLDQKINSELRPIYYGRYVDDILIVLNNPTPKGSILSPESIINNYLIKTGIIDEKRSNDTYKLTGYEHLEIQKDKLIFHFYDHESSWAGLKEFKKDLALQASEFRFLPKDDLNKEISTEAYDIHYEGSVNKLRSIIGVRENVTKLSHHLFERILRYWLGNQKINNNDLDQIRRFYRGRNIFEYCRTWERVFTLLISTNQTKTYKYFYLDFIETINKLVVKATFNSGESEETISTRAKEDSREYLLIAFANALGLTSYNEIDKIELPKKYIDEQPKIRLLAKYLRKSHLIRHQFVSWPLLEYTDTEINLIKADINHLTSLIGNTPDDFDEKVRKIAPRFIHLDEILLFHSLMDLEQQKVHNFGKWNELIANNTFVSDVIKLENDFDETQENQRQDKVEKQKFPIRSVRIKNEYSQSNKKLCIGVANIKVDESTIKASFHPNKRPILSMERQSDIFNLINEAIKVPKCDLIVLPEVSVPYSWLPFMVKQARQKNIGMVFGLEHWPVHKIVNGVEKEFVYNLAATVLPIRLKGGYLSSFISLRNKNHYSPDEIITFESLNINIPDEKPLYERFYWRNCFFTVYNCFELTDVVHRGIFRSKIDLLISISWNQDTNLYSNIIESTVRDLHCYVVQANTSQYGDTRIIEPKSTEKKDIVRVKGGENAVLLKGYIDIEELRDFQSHTYRPDDVRYKPTPAGFNHDEARNRSSR